MLFFSLQSSPFDYAVGPKLIPNWTCPRPGSLLWGFALTSRRAPPGMRAVTCRCSTVTSLGVLAVLASSPLSANGAPLATQAVDSAFFHAELRFSLDGPVPPPEVIVMGLPPPELPPVQEKHEGSGRIIQSDPPLPVGVTFRMGVLEAAAGPEEGLATLISTANQRGVRLTNTFSLQYVAPFFITYDAILRTMAEGDGQAAAQALFKFVRLEPEPTTIAEWFFAIDSETFKNNELVVHRTEADPEVFRIAIPPNSTLTFRIEATLRGFATVPEPGTALLFVFALGAAALARRSKSRTVLG
jgi:hypothetical protein